MWHVNGEFDKTKSHCYYEGFESLYPRYDNYNAINVNKVKDIPIDHDGIMGVPITFLYQYNPDEFEIIGIDRYVPDNPNYGKRFTVNEKEIYARILIQNKQPISKADDKKGEKNGSRPY